MFRGFLRNTPMLEHFFGSKTRVKLLYLFFRNPERLLYVRELSRLIGIQLHAVRRELANLERFGIIRQVETVPSAAADKTDRLKYYQLNTQHVVYRELQAFLGKAYFFEQKNFIDRILHVAGDVVYCLVTGFFTRSQAPTDILLVGTLHATAIEKTISQFEKEFTESIHYTLMDEKEFRERQSVGDIFLTRIFETPHSVIINALS